MYKLAIILLAVFSTSMADVCQKVACTRSNALAEMHNLMNEIKPKYDKVRADFIKYNKSALDEAARYNKTYHDEINAEFTRGEDVLIVPHVHVFPACAVIYEKLLPYEAPAKGTVNDCISRWRNRNSDYLKALDSEWENFESGIDVSINIITDIGKKWVNDIQIDDESQDVINRIKDKTKSSIKYIREDILETLVEPNWVTNSQVKREIDECLEYREFDKLRQNVSDIIARIDNCTSTYRKRYSRH